MHNRQQYLQTNYGNQYTDTYLSTITDNRDRDQLDKSVFKAIKQNNVELIVNKDREPHTEEALFYNQHKELSQILISTRKKYDATRIETAALEKTIKKLEEEKYLLDVSRMKIEKESKEIQQNYKTAESKYKQFDEQSTICEYTHAIRMNMIDNLKHDILQYKKQCFDKNVKLIRTKTELKDLLQRNTNKKHLKSKCQLVLRSLQQTVQYRVHQRSDHIEEVEDLLKKKNENTMLKEQREQHLQVSMQNAMIQRLPDQKLWMKKLLGQTFLREILRSKMKKLIDQYKEVQTAYNTIKKQTRINSVHNFIDDYLSRQQRYGQLLESIAKAEVQTEKEKQLKKDLVKEQQQLEHKVAEIQQQIQSRHPINEDSLVRNLNNQSERSLECNKLQLMVKRWSVKTFIKFKNCKDQKEDNHNYNEYAKQLEGLDTKRLFQKTLKHLVAFLNEKDFEVESPTKSELTTQRTEEKVSLTDLRVDSVLSKNYSRRNFRIKTVATQEVNQQDNNNDYDQTSQYDFLKINRRLVKKNNKTVARPRMKTRAI